MEAMKLGGKSSKYQGTVSTAKPKGIGEGRLYLLASHLIRHIVKIAFRIWKLIVDRWGDEAILYGQDGKYRLGRAGTTQEMSGHRFGRAYRNLGRAIAEN